MPCQAVERVGGVFSCAKHGGGNMTFVPSMAPNNDDVFPLQKGESSARVGYALANGLGVVLLGAAFLKAYQVFGVAMPNRKPLQPSPFPYRCDLVRDPSWGAGCSPASTAGLHAGSSLLASVRSRPWPSG